SDHHAQAPVAVFEQVFENLNSGSNEVLAALARHGTVVVRVASGSMLPTVKVGESVTVRAAPPRLGEVALLRVQTGGFLLHRLVAQLRLGPFTRWVHAGDAPGAGAGLCAADEVLGLAELDGRVPARLQRARWVLAALGRAALARFGGAQPDPRV